MTAPSFIVRRYPYEEPYHLQIELIVSNGPFKCAGDIYVGRDELAEIGQALGAFPRKVPDEYVYEYGSEDPAKRMYRYFRLRAYTIGRRGQTALEVRVNLNQEPPDQAISEFSIQVEAAQLNRLGALFTKFHQLQHLEFRWSDTEDALFEQHQPGGGGGEVL